MIINAILLLVLSDQTSKFLDYHHPLYQIQSSILVVSYHDFYTEDMLFPNAFFKFLVPLVDLHEKGCIQQLHFD